MVRSFPLSMMTLSSSIDPRCLSSFFSYHNRLNVFSCILDPALHTPSYTRQHSTILFTCILTTAAKALLPQTYPSLSLLYIAFRISVESPNNFSTSSTPPWSRLTPPAEIESRSFLVIPLLSLATGQLSRARLGVILPIVKAGEGGAADGGEEGAGGTGEEEEEACGGGAEGLLRKGGGEKEEDGEDGRILEGWNGFGGEVGRGNGARGDEETGGRSKGTTRRSSEEWSVRRQSYAGEQTVV
jgi:hypothetical protein